MKAVVTIEISDSTSEEKLNKAGFTRHEMAYHYQRAFSEIVRMTLHPGCDATINCVVTDNTKEEIDLEKERTMREKLIELLRTACAVNDYCHGHCIECTADHLIANGVTIQDREIDFDYEAEVE